MDPDYQPEPLDRRQAQEYAAVIFLPPHLDALVAPHRERYDPSYHRIAAHLSLVFPFITSLTLDELVRIFTVEVRKVGSIKVALSSIGDFYPQYPVIYWVVKNEPVFNTVYKTLYSRLDLPLPHKQFVPHVTVAREISSHRVMLVKERILPYLPEEEFWAPAIDLVSMVAGHWVSVRSFPLTVR
jgi:2'-5' RNA ligase